MLDEVGERFFLWLEFLVFPCLPDGIVDSRYFLVGFLVIFCSEEECGVFVVDSGVFGSVDVVNEVLNDVAAGGGVVEAGDLAFGGG